MGIYFGGFDELNDKLERMTKEGAAKRDKFVVQEAEILISHAKDNTPVQTGNLRKNWKRTRAVQGKVTVYNNVEYASHVEYGHRQQPGRYVPAIGKRLTKDFVPSKKMLHRAMLQSSKTFKEDAADIIKGLIDE